ncbi:hypothetical protein [Neisseria weixii]|uniref:hypothetical protein n=1 Tax=Neisseria weixii TaxID=1853276 RepID=UPI0035A1B326
MSMQIRRDFQPVPWQLERLLEYAKIFECNNREHWPHLKNREDFSRIYDFKMTDREPLEEIYRVGRDLAVAMSDRLRWFNYPDYCPTLTDFLNEPAFNTGWIAQIPLLIEISQTAKKKVQCLENDVPWAIEQMIILYDEQIKLLKETKKCIDGLKHSEIYTREQSIECGNVYFNILNAINNMGKRFESLPSAYRGKNEESLRDDILVGLSSIAELSTFGEVFNKTGKTDILAQKNGNIEFIGECKFWHGKQGFIDTIEQLMQYLTWRNTKTAVIIFVRNKDITSVLNTAKEAIQQHPGYIRLLQQNDETWLSYEFQRNGIIIEMAMMIYHIPN